jgi:ATP-dependent Clp protease protease subunit
MESFGFEDPFSSLRDRLNRRLLDARTVVINEALTSTVAGQVSQQLVVLDNEPDDPIQVLMSSARDGELESGLSLYDLLRSMEAPVTILGSGRIAGAGVLCFVGGPTARRCALPHAQFQFTEPDAAVDPGSASDLSGEAERLRQRRERMVEILASATGQAASQVDADLEARRTFDAEEAARYGLRNYLKTTVRL